LISGFLAWVVGFARAILDDAAASEAERDNAAKESVHRIKNLLAVVQAIARKIGTETNNLPDHQEMPQARLSALDVAQSVLVRRDWTNANLDEIVKGTLAPSLPNPRLVVTGGPPVIVPARFVSGLCMALYELCTNGLKYGALAPGGGRATLDWRIDVGCNVLEWRETTSGDNAAVERSGFGSILIRTAL
jgi:two-component sensor histidine kinase